MGEQQTAWPEGVIARYLTVGGATVDLTVRYTLPPEPEPFATLASCTGCPAAKETSHYRARYTSTEPFGVDEHIPEAADEEARVWAQAHAATCRAMPKPGGEVR